MPSPCPHVKVAGGGVSQRTRGHCWGPDRSTAYDVYAFLAVEAVVAGLRDIGGRGHTSMLCGSGNTFPGGMIQRIVAVGLGRAERERAARVRHSVCHAIPLEGRGHDQDRRSANRGVHFITSYVHTRAENTNVKAFA